VDLVRGEVTIKQEKTKRAKHLPLSTEARRILVAQGRGLPDALVFPRPPVGRTSKKAVKATPGAWDRAKVWKTFKRALQLAGIRPDLRVHDLRHTAGSWLAQEGFSETVISEVLGHKRPGVTAGYVHLHPEHLRAAVEKLGELSQGNARATLAAKPAGPISL
jgi:integrase